jgi:hypothetical protein
MGARRDDGQAMAVDQGDAFRGRHFTSEVILWALRWYLAFPISYRDLALMLSDRGVVVDHTTLFRWVQAYAATLEKRVRPLASMQRLLARRRDLHQGQRHLDLPVSRRGQPRPDDRLPAFRSAGRRSRHAIFPQGPGTDPYREPAHDYRRQEPGLPGCGERNEAERSCGASRGCGNANTSTTSLSRITGGSNGWLGRGSALAACKPPSEHWLVLRRWR